MDFTTTATTTTTATDVHIMTFYGNNGRCVRDDDNDRSVEIHKYDDAGIDVQQSMLMIVMIMTMITKR